MKIITLKIEIEVPDDYQLDDPNWLLDDVYDPYFTDINIKDVSKM